MIDLIQAIRNGQAPDGYVRVAVKNDDYGYYIDVPKEARFRMTALTESAAIFGGTKSRARELIDAAQNQPEEYHVRHNGQNIAMYLGDGAIREAFDRVVSRGVPGENYSIHKREGDVVSLVVQMSLPK